ncbi:sodium:proton antiporter [Candidatus Margulisiibacteriota bacterium]
MLIYLSCIVLFLVGIYCIAVKRNLIKIIIGIGIMEYAVNLFLVVLGYRTGGLPPIIQAGVKDQLFVDPLPQALVLTAIVIGLATTALMVAIALRIYDRYGTFDITKIRKLRG